VLDSYRTYADSTSYSAFSADHLQSQVDLDEEFARSLLLQEEERDRSRQRYHPQQSQTSQTSQHQNQYQNQQYSGERDGDFGGSGELPYQARVRRNRPLGHQDAEGHWVPPVTDEERREREWRYGGGQGQSQGQGQAGGAGVAGPGMLGVEEKLEKLAEGE
jgi:hypothetical protein